MLKFCLRFAFGVVTWGLYLVLILAVPLVLGLFILGPRGTR